MAKKIILAVAVFLTFFLRFYQLGQIPQGINVDEASYGYDAYSLAKTGKDMWGERHTSLKSFGDFKPAGLSYTIAPFTNYYGLSTFTTRLPSAIFGLMTLVITFYLLKLLLQNFYLALLGSFILALSPWHFGLSRLFYEPVIGLFFITGSIFVQIKYLQKPSSVKYLILASLFAAAGGYYYAVLRYLGLGLLGISILIAHYPKYYQIALRGSLAILCWTILAFPYLSDMFGSKGFVRLQQENALHAFGNALVVNENREMCYISSAHNPFLTKFCYALWNKPGEKLINAGKTFTQLISPKYLFLNGYQKDVLPESYGAYLEILTPLYLLGLFYLLTNLRKNKTHLYIIVSYLFTNLPIAMAGALNIHRNVIGLYFVMIICLYGLYYLLALLNGLPQKSIKIGVILLLSLTYGWSQSRFIANYYFVFTRQQPEIWLSDTPEVMRWLGAYNQGRDIKFYDYDFAPLFYAFYNQLNPHDFQNQARWSDPNQYGWVHPTSLGTQIENKSNMWQEICQHQNAHLPTELLVLTGSRAEWQDVVLMQSKNFTGIHVLHEVYDSKTLYNYLSAKDAQKLALDCTKFTTK